MKPLLKKMRQNWYRILFLAIIFLPILYTQTISPIVSIATWETLSESLFDKLLFKQKVSTKEESKIVLLEVDQTTIDRFGWPLSREYYVQMLNKLEENGHPWILSMLNFQSLDHSAGQAQNNSKVLRETVTDSAFAKAIQKYDRVIGTGLIVKAGEELSIDQEEKLLPDVVLSKKTGNTAIPYLPLQIVESDEIVQAQAKFGFANRFGAEAVIYCAPMMITNFEHNGDIVIPSSLVWTKALSESKGFQTTNGAKWQPSSVSQQNFEIAYKHCLTSPSVLTDDFLKTRAINTISFSTFLDSKTPWDFQNKIVLLSSADAPKFRGPGDTQASEDIYGLVPEHHLTARFLDNLLTGRTIKRDPLFLNFGLSASPVWLGLIIFITALTTGSVATIIATSILLAGALSFATYHLLQGEYLIPIQAIAYLSSNLLGFFILNILLKIERMRKIAALTATLRHNLSIVSTLEELKLKLSQTFERILGTHVTIGLEDYNQELYEAASAPEKAIIFLARSNSDAKPLSQESSLEPTSLTNIAMPMFHSNNPLVAITIHTRLPITSKHGYLGRVFVQLTYRSFESIYIEDMMEIAEDEIAIHWSRIALTAEQKIADYKMLMETTRGNIMERFLSNSLTQKFQNNITMEQNLENVLTPHPARAALLQADIRGYSQLASKLSPLETVKILQKYYKNVVDQAQVVAQIKLIGDCIFLFIERGHGTAEYSPTDLAVKIASTLVAETNKQNAIRTKEGDDPLFFGIAIHYGDVVLGNLSSDYCIDYTVIGPNVNQVARMEELTKHEAIKSRIGMNGVLISHEAAAALQKFKNLHLKTIDLDAAGLKIRSFETISSVSYLTAEDVILIESDLILDQLKGAS